MKAVMWVGFTRREFKNNAIGSAIIFLKFGIENLYPSFHKDD